MTLRPSRPLACLLLVLLVAGVYGRLAGHGFLLWDDGKYVVHNPFVQEGLTWDGVRRAFSLEGYAANYHPLTWLSHMLDVQVFGMRPGPHHLVNALFHALNACLLFLFLVRATGRAGAALAVAALFAVHPLHVESVAWLAERKDVLSLFFALLALSAYERHVRRPSGGRLALVTALFALGVLAKPSVITLPFVLLLLDVWPFGRMRREQAVRLFLEKIPLFVVCALSSWATLTAQRRGGAVQDTALLPPLERIQNALTSYVAYLGKALWPVELPFFYPFPDSFPLWKVAGSGLLLVSVTAWAIRERRRRPCLLVGWLWYLGALVPMIGLVQVGLQAMADRYTYVPMIGVYVAVVFTLADLLRPVVARAAAAVAVVTLAAVACWQVGFWKDDRSLYTRALAVTEGSFVAHHYLGIVEEKEGHRDEAIRHFREAVRIFTEKRRRDSPETRLHLAALLVEAGRPGEAIGHLERAARLSPRDPRIPFNLGVAREALGDLDGARAAFERAVDLAADDWDAWNHLGTVLAKMRRIREARAAFEKAVSLRPDYAPAWNNLGMTKKLQGDLEGARACFRRALAVDPSYGTARANLEALEGSSQRR